MHWQLTFGGVGAEFDVKGVDIDESGRRDAVREVEANAMAIPESVRGRKDEDVDWKGKFRALEMGLMMMKGQLDEAREKVMDAILNI